MTSGVPVKIDFDRVFDILSTSRKSLKAVCEEIGVNVSTALKQIEASPELQIRQTRARENQADFIVQSIFDEIEGCYKIVMSKEHDNVTKHSYVNACKLTIDSFKWIACKFRPHVYGDRVQVDHNLEQMRDKFKSMFTQAKIASGQIKQVSGTAKTSDNAPLRIGNPETEPVVIEMQGNGKDYRKENTQDDSVTDAPGRQAEQPGSQAAQGRQRAPRQQAKKKGGG